MRVVNCWRIFRYWIYRHIGKLSEASLKHRSVILALSVLMMFIDPSMVLTFGKASLVGLGISVDPPQTVRVGFFLLALLIYRLIAFWVSVLFEHGIDPARAERKALYEYDPTFESEEYQPHDLDSLIRHEAGVITYKWQARQILWEFFLPNFLALISLTRYLLLS